MRARGGQGLAALLAALTALGLFAAVASATSYQRPVIGTFGSAEQPSLAHPHEIALDPTSGDVLIVDYVNPNNLAAGETLKRFHADGTPSTFAALGSNVIDGKAGPGGKPCAEEPASCDQTPQNEMDNTRQITVDPTNGNIYVTQAAADVVDIFSSEGTYRGQLTAAGTKKFDGPCGVLVDSDGAVYIAQSLTINKFLPAGAIPVNADNTANFKVEYEAACGMAFGSGPSAGSIFITAPGGNPGPHTLKVDKETGALSEFVKGSSGLVTVDPTRGNPIIGVGGIGAQNRLLVEFDGSGETSGVELSRTVLEGPGDRIEDAAADSNGDLYVLQFIPGVPDSPVLIYGDPAVVPTVTSGTATDITGSQARVSGTVNADGIEVTECVFEWGAVGSGGFINWTDSTPCVGSIPTDSSEHEVEATITDLAPNGKKYAFRVAATNENGTERSTPGTFLTALTTATEPAIVTGLQSATLNGTVRPEGLQYTDCYFEWGLASGEDYEHTAPCDPVAAAIPPDLAPHAVTAPLAELDEATAYRFRLVATNSAGTVAGEELTFETFGVPKILEVRARDADQDSATLEARINPSGFETSYRFEWGPTASYGNVAPAAFEPIGSGQDPVRVSAEISGLPAGSAYHYRLIASGPGGTATSTDQLVETLNSCGLPDGRCYELVSRRDAGPVAFPGMVGETLELDFQAAPSGPGGLAYTVESGYPDATKGYEVLYRGTRGASGWTSTQISSPIVARNEKTSPSSLAGRTRWLSDDLACGFTDSSQPLTDDPGPQLHYERGGSNLYRFNPDGTYTAVTELASENLGGSGYDVAGASQDCSMVLFASSNRYPGIVGAGTERLYEWDEGTLRNAGIIPGPSGQVVAEVSAAGFNAVSRDGSRVFLRATRQTSSNLEEIGKPGIFVREDGITRDISLSQTSTASKDPAFLWATSDGSRVFFLANAGLTEDSSPSGTDLYRYDLESEELTNLSVNDRPGGAQVAGFVGASEDGSHVYFAARGQLVAGEGSTMAENQSAGTYSVYSSKNGTIGFVGTVDDLPTSFDNVAIRAGSWGGWSSRVSPDGRYLLFQSTEQVTDYDSGGGWAAYLYDAEGGSAATVCISCRPDGAPPVDLNFEPVAALKQTIKKLVALRSLVVRNGRPQVYFSSRDALAPGAEEDRVNVYEWSHGQVFLLARERPEVIGTGARFVGASADGSDIYLVTPEELSWEDPDERLSVYTARVGGGFPEPPPAPAPCDSDVEGSCQGSSQAPVGAIPGAASAGFTGPGNAKPAAEKKQRKGVKKKKRGAKKRKGQKQKSKAKRKRAAGADRRAGK